MARHTERAPHEVGDAGQGGRRAGAKQGQNLLEQPQQYWDQQKPAENDNKEYKNVHCSSSFLILALSVEDPVYVHRNVDRTRSHFCPPSGEAIAECSHPL